MGRPWPACDCAIVCEPDGILYMQGNIVRISRRGRHMIYEYPSWAGDSGSCSLAMYDGQVVGMHQEGVNHFKEIVERKRTLAERMTEVEESIESAARSVAQGAVALLASSFPDT